MSRFKNCRMDGRARTSSIWLEDITAEHLDEIQRRYSLASRSVAVARAAEMAVRLCSLLSSLPDQRSRKAGGSP
jgi:hypothetical protein